MIRIINLSSELIHMNLAGHGGDVNDVRVWAHCPPAPGYHVVFRSHHQTYGPLYGRSHQNDHVVDGVSCCPLVTPPNGWTTVWSFTPEWARGGRGIMLSFGHTTKRMDHCMVVHTRMSTRWMTLREGAPVLPAPAAVRLQGGARQRQTIPAIYPHRFIHSVIHRVLYPCFFSRFNWQRMTKAKSTSTVKQCR